jgi:protoporphyrinogen/coproporphyrinogen III oxidase
MKAAVIGGGITGLAAALFLQDRGADVTLYEAADDVGGVLQTVHDGGLLMEKGPDAFVRLKPSSIKLCERLHVDVVPTAKLATAKSNASIVCGGRLHALPDGLQLLAPTRLAPFATSGIVSWPGKLRMGMDLVLPTRKGASEDDDESLADFVRRRLGQEALERIAQPLVGGIYSGDPEKLSLRATMPRLLDLERKHRSLILGMRRTSKARASGARYSLFVTPESGMRTLVDAVVETLIDGGAKIETGARVQRLDEVAADAIVLALPARVSADLLEGELAAELAAIRTTSSATINFAWPAEAIPRELGYGFVVPAIEGRFVMACTVASNKYEGRGDGERAVARAYVGGALGPDITTLSDAELIEGARRDLSELMGIQIQPSGTVLSRHVSSQPQYEMGHLARVARIEALAAGLEGVAIAGNSFRGVGVADCIDSARRAVDRLLPEPS